MIFSLNVPDYSSDMGVVLNWENDFQIKVSVYNGEVLLEANEGGLVSLANHLLNLAQPAVPSGAHIHLDKYNSLDDGSSDLVIGKL